MTTDRTRHLGVRIARPADEVYAFTGDPTSLPAWAPGLGASVEKVDGQWVADSPMGRVAFAFVPPNAYGVLDHEVTLPTGDVVTNPMRVIADGAAACDVVFTVRRQPGMSDEDFERDAASIERDLATLKRVLENQ